MRLQFCLALTIWVVALGVRGLTPLSAAAHQGQTPVAEVHTLRGRVVDGRTGAPLEKVLVLVEDAGKSVLTATDGGFEIAGVPAGPHHLYVSVVGYALERREITLAAGMSPLIIPLGEGTATYSETVTVTAGAFREPVDPIPSAQILGSAELQNLRGVLADDPLRAVQVLPGVATGDDLRSEFTVRGSDFRHITFTVDGFATPYLLHTVRGVEDRGPTGSVAMINSDVLEDVTLLNGGYPQRYGGHTGAEVDFRLRDGSRDRRRAHASVSGTAASAVAEGPIGSAHKGSWLISGRQSYLDLVVHRLSDDAFSFGFSDAQAKVAYDLVPGQRVDLTVLAGRSRFQNAAEATDIDNIFVGRNASAVAVGGWRFTNSRVLLAERVLVAENHFRNENADRVELDRGKDRQLAWRSDAAWSLHPRVQIEGGGDLERRDDSRLRKRRSAVRESLVTLDDYSADATHAGVYTAARWTPVAAVTLSPGVRADRWTLTRADTASPWMQAEWRVTPETRLRASTGIYHQFPDFDQVLGVSGAQLQPERAKQYDVGVDRRIGRAWRVTATGYDREEFDVIRRPGSETRVEASRVVRGSRTAIYANRLDGYARGLELLVQRSSAHGISGWLSYAFSHNRYRDRVNGETFWGDFDQRHTLNAYALYRWSERASFVAKLRVGSNIPIPGYLGEQGDEFFVTDVRNTARLPVYSRLDFRANRTFNWSRRRLTLFGEVINVLNRENVRFTPPGINVVTRQASRPFDSMLPIIPSAGVLIEF